MDTARWALAFTLLPWPEARKAALWASLQAGQEPAPPPGGRRKRSTRPACEHKRRGPAPHLAKPGVQPGAESGSGGRLHAGRRRHHRPRSGAERRERPSMERDGTK